MIIGFLGKGGSGKSTMATAFVRALQAQGKKVLAIDADHNMDLAYALAGDLDAFDVTPSLFLGNDPDMIKTHVGATKNGSFVDAARIGKERGVNFTLSPIDAFTAKKTIKTKEGLLLMVAGPHTDRVRSHVACSHSLAAPLKTYLPLVRLAADEAIVIDERAGCDPVANGILSGVDLAVIVREETVNSRRVAKQIQDELELAKVPYLIVENKKENIQIDTGRAVELILKYWQAKK